MQQYAWTLLALLALLTTYLYPLSYDNNTYQSMAWQLVERSKLPYIGTWDQNFPGIVYLHSLAIVLFGNNEFGLRTLDILIQLIFTLSIYRVTSRHYDTKAAPFAALFYIAIYVFYGGGMFAQRDVYAGGFVLLALWAAYKRLDVKNELFPFLAGLAMACAVLIRPTYAPCVLAIVWPLWHSQARSKALLLAALGAVLTAVVGLWPYFTNAEYFREFYNATIAFNTDLYSVASQRIPLAEALRNPVEWTTTLLLLFQIAIIVRWTRQKRNARLLPFAISITLAVVIIKIMIFWMGKYFVYHYGPVYILLSPVTGYGLYRVASVVSAGWPRRSIFIAYGVAFLSLIVVRSPLPIIASTEGSWRDRMLSVQEAFAINRWNTLEEKHQIINYIQQNTGLNDEIEHCSMDNEVTWRSERPQASRFTLIHPLGMQKNGRHTQYQEEWQQEFVDVLADGRPKLMMLNSEPGNFLTFLTRTPEEILHSIPGFDDALSRNYVHDSTIGSWTIYRRRNGPQDHSELLGVCNYTRSH